MNPYVYSRQRWENNLMGWASSGDPLSNMQVCISIENVTFFVVRKLLDWFKKKLI
jgi:hypothetical protein